MARSRVNTAPPRSRGRAGRATSPRGAKPSSAHPLQPGLSAKLVRISALARLAGVPAPTLKHYMREGLLPPAEVRSSRTSAYYDARLAARVMAIKDLQTRRFLPLKLIAELLEPPPSARLRADAEETLRRHFDALEPAIRAGTVDAGFRRGRRPHERRTRDEVLAALAITGPELDDLAVSRLVEPVVEDGVAMYGGPDLEILEIIDEVRARGMGDLFPMPILAPYAAAVRTLVRVELELFRRQVLTGSALPPRPLDEVAREATRLGERLVVAMRAKFVIPELRDAAGGSDPTRR